MDSLSSVLIWLYSDEFPCEYKICAFIKPYQVTMHVLLRDYYQCNHLMFRVIIFWFTYTYDCIISKNDNVMDPARCWTH